MKNDIVFSYRVWEDQDITSLVSLCQVEVCIYAAEGPC